MKKLKKGFTLIELIASIGIIAVIILMATISYTQIRKNILNSQYSNLKVLIEQTAVKYSSKNGYRYFFVQDLIDDGMLETDDTTNIYDPRDKSILNCHILNVSEDDNGNLSANMQKDDHMEDGKCKTTDIDVYKGSLTLTGVLNNTTIEYPGTVEVTDSTLFPRITLDGWTNEQVKFTAELSQSVSNEERTGGRFVWNKDANVVTEYPSNAIVTNANGVVNDKYFVDFYTSSGDQYEANTKFKFDNEAPVIYQEEHNKPRLASGSTNSKWSRSKTVIMYATDKDGVGLQRIYIGRSACSQMLTNANLGQPAVPGMIQTVTVYDNVGTTAENYHICAVDKLGNLTDGGTIAIARIDNTPPDVEETFYVYNETYGMDATKYYPTQPLDSFVNRDIDIANYHDGGWTATGHFYAFKVTDVSSTYNQMRITVNYTPSEGEYKDAIPYSNRASRTLDDINCFYDAFTGKGKRKMRYEICDGLNNCRIINITNDNVDKTPPVTPTMNFIINATSGQVYTDNTWINQTIIAARKTNAAAPTTTDKGSGVAKYQISDDNSTWVDYHYDGTKALYAMSTTGTHKRYFRAIDKVGNISSVKTLTAKIDKVKPTLNLQTYKYNSSNTNNLGDVFTSLQSFSDDTYTASNPYVIGNVGSWYNYGFVFANSATDTGGSGVKSIKWSWAGYQSATDPIIGQSDPNNIYNSTDSRTHTSNLGTTDYGWTITGEGYRRTQFIVTDNAGNTTTVNTVSLIDKSAPTNITSKLRTNNSSGTVRSNTTTWTKDTVWWGDFSASDTYSGVKDYEYNSGPNCNNNNGGTLNKTNGHTYSVTTSVDFCTRAVDNAGNRSDWVKWTYIRVDKTPPTVEAFHGGVLHADTNFDSGNNDLVVYNNSKNGTVTHTRLKGTTNFGDNKYYIRIKTAGTASPGLGGFYFADPVSANKEYIAYIYAKIPTGYTLNFATNSCGDNRTEKWITTNTGTGNWKAYVHYVKCGSTGSFANTNFFYINGAAATSSNPVTWDVSYATILDPTKWATRHYILSRATDEHSKLASYTLTRASNDVVSRTHEADASAIHVDRIDVTGTYPVVYKDMAGNSTTTNVAVDHVDAVPPTCGSQFPAPTTWTNENREIILGCFDDGVGCEKTSYSNTWTTTTKQGSMTIKDKLGNSKSCTVNVYVDKTKPTCGTVSGQSTTWTNSDRYISVGCSDSDSLCTNSTFGYTFKTTTKTNYLTIKDNAGNTNTCPINVYVDKTKPTIKVTAYSYDGSASNKVGSTTYNSEQPYSTDSTIYVNSGSWVRGVTFKFDITDGDSGIKSVTWRWDEEYKAGSYATTTNGGSEGDIGLSNLPTFYENLTGSGQRKAIIKAEDNAGNVTTVTIYAKVDYTPPTVPNMYFVYGDWSPYDGSTTPNNVYANTSAKNGPYGSTDTHSGVAGYQIKQDNGSWTNYSYSSSNSLYAMTTSGTHKRYFRAYDSVGNYSSERTVTAVIDKNLPSCSFSTQSGTLSSSGWYTTSATIKLNTTNAVKAEMRCPDCRTENEYTQKSTWSLTVDTKPTGRGVQARVTSSSGAVAYCYTVLYKDTAAPKVTATANNSTYTGNFTVTKGTTVTFHCNDAITTNSYGDQFYSGFGSGSLKQGSTTIGTGQDISTTVNSTATYTFHCQDIAGHYIDKNITVTVGSSQSSGGTPSGGSGSCVCSGSNFKSIIKYNATCPSGQTRYEIYRLCANIKLGCKKGSYSRTISNLSENQVDDFTRYSGVVPSTQPPSATNALSTYSYSNCVSATSCSTDTSHLYQYFKKYENESGKWSIVKYQCDSYINGTEYFDRYHDTEYPYACCTS